MKKIFRKTNILVKELLTNHPETRNSDALLYIKVVQRLNSSALEKPFEEVMTSLEEMGLPCFETVRRTRQKLQNEFPNLQADEIVQDFRSYREEEFRKEFGRK